VIDAFTFGSKAAKKLHEYEPDCKEMKEKDYG
jgi:hypothetical protein